MSGKIPAMVGRIISHYEVLERIGEGGMGVVYKARDTSLNRYVAIKALSPLKTADPEARRRLFQEARLASSLNHPNIVTIHDFVQEGGTDYIVMEFVTGRTLSDLIRHGALDLKESLRIAIQVADALARAHAEGVVHRDLKPTNVIVTEQGLVKVLDFGLAKFAAANVGVDVETVDLEPMTEEGTVLGTCPYMSPEQAEGRAVDARSDIFSFGSLLYEMATGERAFQGASQISVLGAIVRGEPKPAREVRASIPADLERIIVHCLRKEPGKRFQHMTDVKTLLEEIQEESESGMLAAAAVAKRRNRRWAYAAVLGLALLASGLGLLVWLTRPGPVPFKHFRQMTKHAALSSQPAISPDGRMLAYASDHAEEGNLDIWVQQVGGGSAVRITTGPEADCQPTFAGSGTKIAYASFGERGGIYIVPALGGSPRRIAASGAWPSFSPDGGRVAYSVGSRFAPSKLYVADVDGNAVQEFATDVAWASSPSWSPDGTYILFEGSLEPAPTRAPSFDWWLAPASGGKSVRTGLRRFLVEREIRPINDTTPALESRVVWGTARNALLFAAVKGDSTNLWQVTISLKDGKPLGEPERLTTSADQERQPAGHVDGRIAYTRISTNDSVWRLPLNSSRGTASGELARFTEGAAQSFGPILSPDGLRLVFASDKSGDTEIWLRDLESGRDTQLTNAKGWEYLTRFSPDGDQITYCRGGSGRGALLVLNLTSGIEKKLLDDVNAPVDWSPDGKRIYYLSGDPAVLRAVEVASGRTADFLAHPQHAVRSGAISPDGRWISFRLVTGPQDSSIFVAPFRDGTPPEESTWVRITDGSNDESWWSPDGNLLYFLSRRDGFRCIWVQRLDPVTKRPLGRPAAVQHFHKRLRIPGGISFGRAMGRDSLYCGLRETTGDIWWMDSR